MVVVGRSKGIWAEVETSECCWDSIRGAIESFGCKCGGNKWWRGGGQRSYGGYRELTANTFSESKLRSPHKHITGVFLCMFVSIPLFMFVCMYVCVSICMYACIRPCVCAMFWGDSDFVVAVGWSVAVRLSWKGSLQEKYPRSTRCVYVYVHVRLYLTHVFISPSFNANNNNSPPMLQSLIRVLCFEFSWSRACLRQAVWTKQRPLVWIILTLH